MDLGTVPVIQNKVGRLERDDALRHAFSLVRDVQDEVLGADTEVRRLLRRAEDEGWPDVARAALFANAVRAFEQGSHREVLEAIDRLRSSPLTDGDPVAAAMALALGAATCRNGPSSSLAEPTDADLARATVLLRSADTDALTLASAYNCCARAYGQRRLWELQDDHYAAADRLLSECDSTPLAATVLFNRAELHLNWACALREIGDRSQVAQRRHAATAILAAASRVDMPVSWRLELRTFDVVLDALDGRRNADEARMLLATMTGSEDSFGHAWLALALATGDAAAAERAVKAISPPAAPDIYDLALLVAAELAAPGAPPAGAGAVPSAAAGLRYAQRHCQLRWDTRLASLAVMRSLIQVEELRAEHELLARHAYHDDLTGLANRRELRRRSTDLEASGVADAAVLLVDVDEFKHVNDAHGHQAGDEALVALGSILSSSIREGDLAVRLGGDEFAVLLAQSDAAAATRRAEEIVAAVATYPWGHIRSGLTLTVSIGVSSVRSSRIEHLVSDADLGLYRAKAAGGSKAVTAGATA